MFQIGQNFTLFDIDHDEAELILVDDDGTKYRVKVPSENRVTCGNCGDGFIPTDAHPLGFCCSHCVNQHRGDDCDEDCAYCRDCEK